MGEGREKENMLQETIRCSFPTLIFRTMQSTDLAAYNDVRLKNMHHLEN